MTFTTMTWRDPLLISYQSTTLFREKDSIFVQMVLLIYVCVCYPHKWPFAVMQIMTVVRVTLFHRHTLRGQLGWMVGCTKCVMLMLEPEKFQLSKMNQTLHKMADWNIKTLHLINYSSRWTPHYCKFSNVNMTV